MASYRFSVGIVRRSAGQCAVACAAYRAGADLVDERTQQRADYTRRRGVVHAEILAPDNAPEWMREREALWNAVEKAEKRGDAQLAREVQLSLPHELDAAQRLELVRSFAREQWVARGMIADIAVHAPGREGDDRNHHAHVMLTMRELTGEGFGKKARDWNGTANIERWRAEWAQHQNREFARLGIDARVDHRSFAAQGIDREPECHEGPAVTAMRRRGRDSRVANDNEQVRARNARRADMAAELVQIESRLDRDHARFAAWKEEKANELEAALAPRRLDQTRRHELERDALEERLDQIYGGHLRTMAAEATAVQRRLEQGGVRGGLRRMFGFAREDRRRLEDLQAGMADGQQRMEEMRGKLRLAQEREREELARRQEARRQQQQEGFARAEARKDPTRRAREARAARLREALERAEEAGARQPQDEAARGAQTPAEGREGRRGHEQAPAQEAASQRAAEAQDQAAPETRSKREFFAELDAARQQERHKDHEAPQRAQKADQAKAAGPEDAADPEAARREWARREAERIRQRISDKGKGRDGPEFER